jgi:zinc transport system ATP-binding protein
LADAAVEIQGVSFTYPDAESPALENISLTVQAGERLGILGPNGGGKSTLLRIILGLTTPRTGTVRVFGHPPAEARRRGLIGYVAQRPDLELTTPISVRDVVTLGAAWRASPFVGVPREARARVSRMIDLVGATPFADRPIGKLSGGQLQRTLIARALAADIRILALDEPTVGIDAAGQSRFAELLDRVHKELNLTVIIVTHDLRAIVAGSDRVACLAQRLHSHTSPRGLTPQILAELFAHDISGIGGALAGVHVHAHGPGEPCGDPSHQHSATSGGPVPLTMSSATRRSIPDGSGGNP